MGPDFKNWFKLTGLYPITSEQTPLIINGRTLAPLRAVCEALRLGVSWDGDTGTIKISDEFNLVVLTIDSTTIDVNGELRTLEAPAQIVNGHTVVPIRAVAEAFGAKGVRTATLEEFEKAFREANEADGPVIIDCLIDCDEFVLPMLPPGGSMDDIITEKGE